MQPAANVRSEPIAPNAADRTNNTEPRKADNGCDAGGPYKPLAAPVAAAV